MSYKLAFLLSFLFMIQVLLFSGDLAALEAIHNELDAVGLTVGYQISMIGSITPAIKEFVFQEAHAEIRCVSGCSSQMGEALSFELSRRYEPIIISKNEMTITVRRTAIIGYFS